ncbi:MULTISPECIES: ABC transporter permease [Streptomyces]|uniref:ABC transporter permease n=1 Tax=Streptomyces tendae TaxID=1932 RepID=A0ABX5ZZP7_STRTE|nr:ABC transporter permease [Streptomyces tendae]QER89635.1 ABC transporter permease [Streptomyces tendae]
MTAALTTPAAAGRPARAPRQWRWLARLHRPALICGGVLVLLTAAALLWLGGPLTDGSAAAWKAYNACGFTPVCSYDQSAILLYKDVYNWTTFAVLAVPFLVAAWAGGALVGRETESGTARLAWTQGVSPARWLASRLVLPAVLTAAGTGLLAGLHHWAWATGRERIDNTKFWYDPATFHANGIVPVTLALTGLAAGALAGLLLRRAMAALAAAAVTVGVLWAGVHAALPYLWPSVTRVSSLREGPLGKGLQVGEGVLTAGGGRATAPCHTSQLYGCRDTLADMGATAFYRDLHPASHYWPLQLVASGILLAVACLLTYAAFRAVRHSTGTARG